MAQEGRFILRELCRYKIGTFAEAGSQRVYLQTLDLADLDHLELVASEVMPQLQ